MVLAVDEKIERLENDLADEDFGLGRQNDRLGDHRPVRQRQADRPRFDKLKPGFVRKADDHFINFDQS